MIKREFEFNLAISAEKLQRVYRGNAKYLLVYTDEGLKLQLPALNFRPFVTVQGIHGRYRVRIDGNNKILDLKLIG
ncbi:MAG: DUF2835 domain-containing protein [Gammaproteobacteria bacterium]|nr:DUF2835 domain-containing protein [Gammaproteobacteria bacterium]